MTERNRADDAAEALETELDDATVVVPVDDATIAVQHEDHTLVVHTRDIPSDSEVPPASTDPGSTVNTGGATRSASRDLAGAPVEDVEEIPPALARLFFKNPLDPKRRAPESPFPKEQSSLPRGGVRASIPVVYGARPEVPQLPDAHTEFSRWIGPPPAGYELPLAERSALPSTARLNRRFRLLAYLGGAAVTVVTVGGVWAVVAQLLQG